VRTVRKLSILVPVYNESATVEALLRRVARVKFPVDREIVVVDDGSSDGSIDILKRMEDEGLIRLLRHAVNQGKGAAIQTALHAASGDVVVVQDADLELDPNDLPTLLEPIRAGQTEVCLGSRFFNGRMPAPRWSPTPLANRLLNGLSNRINGLHLTDFNTCYKMMTAAAFRRLSLCESGFAMEPEITGKLARLGYRIEERPVQYQPRTFAAGKKIRPFDLFRYLAAMIRYRWFWRPEHELSSPATVPQPAGG
jgi:glycosyltransferase involved in cell wall biosynthesis